MRIKLLTAAALAYLAVIVACSTFFPASEDGEVQAGPVFDHKGHLERGLECSDCHGDADVGFNAMPDLELCQGCHEEIDPEQADPMKRSTAFFAEDGSGKWRHGPMLDDELIFEHARHVEAVEGDCSACHGAIAESTAIPSDDALSMQDCMGCHRDRAPEKNECATCHTTIRSDRQPPSHDGGWIREHGRVARFGGLDPLPEDCSYCHHRTSCDDCHRAEPPRSHTNLWRFHGHAAAASLDRTRCETCHTTDSCIECHRSTEPRNHRVAWAGTANRHCVNCHLPLGSVRTEGCAMCHDDPATHDSAPDRPLNSIHQTAGLAACRACHSPPEHPDNGQSCLLCHK